MPDACFCISVILFKESQQSEFTLYLTLYEVAKLKQIKVWFSLLGAFGEKQKDFKWENNKQAQKIGFSALKYECVKNNFGITFSLKRKFLKCLTSTYAPVCISWPK